MQKYNLGGGLKGELAKVNFRKAQKFENGKAFSFSSIDKGYINFLSAVKKVVVGGVRQPKSNLTFNLVKKLYVQQDSKTKFWIASDKKMK